MVVSGAEEIARRALASRTRLHTVDGDAWPQGEPVPPIYAPAAGFPRGCWLVYVGSDGDRVGSSTVIVISKADGAVLFHGEVGE